MEISPEDVQQDGARKKVIFSVSDVSIDDARENTSRLIEWPTNQLIVLLRLVRQERTTRYNSLRIIKKGIEHNGDFQKYAEIAGEDYEYWTRKAWVLENIIRDRSGYFPEKITDDYICKVIAQIEKINQKPMRINPKNSIISDTKG
ncbi:hypothetical protein [Paenibacillus kribbensis]|uniref:hypothetical protein n=1 Tax=Paenibacillus kribbensis TaxID=172713 RepID=UPI000839193C|nr:hypothetical protein [Paenibacillus kribbensis]